MYSGVEIRPPFFEVGPKAYAFGADVLELARRADELSDACDVRVILTPQYVDIPVIAREVRNVLVFAQHMDSLPRGRGQGSVLPEALKAAGAAGVMLNHVERRVSREELVRTIERADEVGLATMVCADDADDAVDIARLGPNVIIVESPALIGSRSPVSERRASVAETDAAILRVQPNVRILHGAGISSAQDVYDVIAAGAQATGSSSAIFDADDPPVDAGSHDQGGARRMGQHTHRAGATDMTVYHETFTIQSDRRPTFHDVTAQVEEVLARSSIKDGTLMVYSQHTTCSVLIQEASDDVDYWGTELLMVDLVTILEGLVPTCRTDGQYHHPGPKHIMAGAGRDELGVLVAQYRRPPPVGHHGTIPVRSRPRRGDDAG